MDRRVHLLENGHGLIEIGLGAVLPEVFEMRPHRSRTLGQDGLPHHPGLVVILGLPDLDLHSPFRTGPDAGAETVTEEIADQPGLPVDHLEGPFGTVGDAEPAAVALIFVDLDDFPFHDPRIRLREGCRR